jgi:hypothetical protein
MSNYSRNEPLRQAQHKFAEANGTDDGGSSSLESDEAKPEPNELAESRDSDTFVSREAFEMAIDLYFWLANKSDAERTRAGVSRSLAEILRVVDQIPSMIDVRTKSGWIPMIVSLRSGMPFGILNDLADLAALIEIRAEGDSIATRKKIDKFLQGKAKAVLADIRRRLGIRAGRPRDEAKRKNWLAAALQKQDDRTWGMMARMLDPEGYAKNSKEAADRMRLGAQRVLPGLRTRVTRRRNSPPNSFGEIKPTPFLSNLQADG